MDLRTHGGQLTAAYIGLSFLWFAWVIAGVDAMTVVYSWTPLSIILCALPALWASIAAGIIFWGPYRRDPYAGPMYELRKDRVGVWHLAGACRVLLAGGAMGFLVLLQMQALAQHLPGKQNSFQGTVRSVVTNHSPKNPCESRITVEANLGERIRFCVGTRQSRAIGPYDLEEGEEVIVLMRDTALGSVATAVRRN